MAPVVAAVAATVWLLASVTVWVEGGVPFGENPVRLANPLLVVPHEEETACPGGCGRGVCHLALRRCDCPYGYGGADCETQLLPACTLPSGEVLSCHALVWGKPCECQRQCKALGRTRWLNDQLCYVDPRVNHSIGTGPFPPEDFIAVRWYSRLEPDEVLASMDAVLREFRPPSQCPNQCSHRGWCRAHGPCECFIGFGGASCEVDRDIYCLNGCSKAGVCDRGFCRCDVGRYGVDCSLPRPPASRNMRNMPRIYVYEYPAPLVSWYLTEDMWKSDFSKYQVAGIIYGSWRSLYEQLLHSPARTEDPEEADFFFLPTMIHPVSSNLGPFQWRLEEVMNYAKSNFPYWNRNGGKDHFWIQPQDVGPCLIPPELRAPIILGHFGRTVPCQRSGSPWACMEPNKDIVIPPAVNDEAMKSIYHLRSPLARPPIRNIMFSFAGDFREGDYSDGVRQEVKRLFEKEPDFKVVRWSNDAGLDMRTSLFCLAPTGHGWGIRLPMAVLQGCIPVIIQDDTMQYFEDILPYEDFSLRVAQKDIPKLPTILRAVPPEEIARKQAMLARVWRYFLWDKPGVAFRATLFTLAKRKQQLGLGPLKADLAAQ